MITVKYKSVSIRIYPLEGRRGYFQFRDGKGKRVTRSSEKEAKLAAAQAAREIFKGSLDLSTLDPRQLAAVRRMIEADPSCRLIDEYLVWHARQRPEKPAGQAIDEFLKIKGDNRGSSSHNVENLTRYLAMLPRDVSLSEITPQVLTSLFPENTAPRTRKNMRGAWVTFFRWAKKMGYLPRDEDETAADRLEVPIVLRKVPVTYDPGEIAVLLRHVDAQYLPWLVLSSFAGIRSEELSPSPKSDKSPLDWSDFHWDRSLIIIRPETDKNGQRRVIPILPVVLDWLDPAKKKSGRVGPLRNPAQPRRSREKSETTRLGEFIGGWKKNAPRHSFISYRSAIVGLAQTAMEAGNSESEAKKSYNDAKGRDEAEKWFATTRKVVSKLP